MATITQKTLKMAVKDTYEPPKKLSKAGEWLKNNPGGIGTIVDMRAVMK